MSIPPPDLAAALADRYRLERELGAGGMAVVFLATDLKHQRQVAVKVLRADVASAVGAERFLAEIRITAGLDHPRILTLIDSGTAGGFVYYVLPYVRGESLRALLDREGTLPFPRVLEIVSQVASALDYAHRQGIIHRDLKPDNILLFEGEAMLADFGIALAVADLANPRLTQEGHSLGTPYYMSPEQAAGERALTPQSDIYSLAAMTYEMLAGDPPFEGRSAQEIVAKVLTDTAPELRAARGDVPPPVSAQLRRAMAKEPRARPASASEFSAGLRATLEPATVLIAAGESVRAHRRSFLLGAIGMLVGAAVVGGTLWLRHAGPVASPAIQLTNSGRADLPAISPDGSQIAYVEWGACDDPRACPARLMLRETATDASRILLDSLTSAFPYQWSPDGLWLLFNGWGPALSGGHGQYVISRLGGSPTPVGTGIALFTPRGDSVLTAVSEGSGEGRPIPVRFFAPPWQAPSDSVLVSPPGPGLTIVTLRLQLAGPWMALGWFDALGQRQLVTIADRRGRTTDTLEADSPHLLRWSPDQRALLVPLRTDQREGTPAARMLRIAIDQRTGRAGRSDTITVAVGMESRVSYDYSADGRALAYAGVRPGPSRVRLWTRGATGAPIRDTLVLTTPDPVRAVVVPDGDRVLLRRRLPGAARQWQWSIGPFGARPDRFVAVTPPLPDAYDAIAVDRAALYLLRWDTTTATRIIRYPLAGGAPRMIATGLDAVTALALGPAGSVLVVLEGGAELRLLDSLGQERWRATIADSLGRVASLLPIPDGGGWVGFAQPLDLMTGPDGNIPVPLLRVSAADGRIQKVADFRGISLAHLAVSADGQLHFAMSTARDQVFTRYRVPIAGGRPVKEGSVPPGSCTVSREARSWACVESDQLSDIFLVRDLPGLR